MASPGLLNSLVTSCQSQDAVDALKGRSNVEVIAYLTFARSCQQDLQYRDNHNSLPFHEYNAVQMLREWTDEAVLRELQWARRRRQCNLQLR